MKYDSNRKWYTAKDIKELLDITSGQLFHWGRTWSLIKPNIKAEGRQGKDKYSFKNLLRLSLIKELLNYDISLASIRQILRLPFKPGTKDREGRIYNNIFDFYKEFMLSIETKKRFDCYITITAKKIARKKIFSWKLSNSIDKGFLFSESSFSNNLDYVKSVIVIDLRRLIEELEEKTGERL